jgi:hypothetical protein
MGRHAPRPIDAPFLCVRCASPRVVDFETQVVCSDCGAVMPADAPVPEPEPVSLCGRTDFDMKRE